MASLSSPETVQILVFIIRPPGTLVPEGLMFYCRCFFISFSDAKLWSTNKKVIGVHVDAPKWNFSRDYISARKGCWPLKFLHVFEMDQSLLEHTPNGNRGPPKI